MMLNVFQDLIFWKFARRVGLKSVIIDLTIDQARVFITNLY